MNKKGMTVVLREFFGLKPGQTAADFLNEIKAVPQADRLELAQLAAIQLGYTTEVVDFQLAA